MLLTTTTTAQQSDRDSQLQYKAHPVLCGFNEDAKQLIIKNFKMDSLIEGVSEKENRTGHIKTSIFVNKSGERWAIFISSGEETCMVSAGENWEFSKQTHKEPDDPKTDDKELN